jgi:hypothetical protein
MANYFLHVKTFSRGKGSSVTRAAAYRAGERIRDEGSSAVYDYTDRTEVIHAEIVLPAEFSDSADMEWARDRSVLWNAVQHSGRQWNSRLAREVLVHLPPELTAAQCTALVRTYSRELADRYRCAVDFAVHGPRPPADPRFHHAHVLMTTRQVGPEGLGARTTPDLSGTERRALGLGPARGEWWWMRERWAQVANEALREAGVAARIDLRNYAARGIDREPTPLLPHKLFYAERTGGPTEAGDRIRANYRERVEARLQGSEALVRVVKRQREENRQRLSEWRRGQKAQKEIPRGAMTREQRNEKRREWCKANAEEVNRKQRERRRANAEEFNRKQREYVRRRRAEKQAAKRSLGLQEQQPAQAKAHLSAITKQNTGSLGQTTSSVSAEQSVKNWLAYRESQTKAAPSKSPSQGHSRDPGAGGADNHNRDSTDKNTQRSRKNDLTL